LKLDVLPVDKVRLQEENGCLITNPPYGERLGDKKDAEKVTRQLGALLSGRPDWSVFVLSPNRQFEHQFGRPADRRRKLYNGRIECQLYQYWASGHIYRTAARNHPEGS